MKIRSVLISAALSAAMLLTACGSGEMTMKELSEGAQVVSSDSSVGNMNDITLTDGDLIAVFDIKGYGTIKAKLFPDIAPVGVDNFKQLCDSGYYDGLTIHRVIDGFMFQGGSVHGDGTGGNAMVNGGSFGIETDLEKARHFYGALCYANAMGVNTCQFYIVNNKEPQDISEFNIAAYESYAAQFDEAAESYKDNAEAYDYYSFQADYYRTTVEAVNSISESAKTKYAEVGGTPGLDGNYTVFGQVYDGFDVIDNISSVQVVGEENSPVKTIVINSVKVYTFSTAE